MEIIRKKICLEDFISRIPSKIDSLSNERIETSNSWGKIAKNIPFNGIIFNYKDFISLYYSLFNIFMNAKYYEYDMSGNSWIKLNNYDWRNNYIYEFSNDGEYNITKNMSFNDVLPEFNINIGGNMNGSISSYDRTVIGIVSENDMEILRKYGVELGLDFNKIVGKEIVPLSYAIKGENDEITYKTIEGSRVPKTIYISELDDTISFMNELYNKRNVNCCEKEKYNEYGGDNFKLFLEKLNTDVNLKKYGNTSDYIPCISIPFLLTTNYMDLGQYTVNNVDVVDENKEYSEVGANNNINNIITNVVKTSGASKLKTLRVRKRSIDDYSNELPGILVINDDKTINNRLEMPYKVNYIKNLSLNFDNTYSGDMIVEMNEKAEGLEVNKNRYDSAVDIIRRLEKDETKNLSGTTGVTLSNIITNLEAVITGKTLVYDYVEGENNDTDIINNGDYDSKNEFNYLVNKLSKQITSYITNEFPKVYTISQDYLFNFIIKKKEFDKVNSKYIETELKQIDYKGTIYAIYNNTKIEIIYVLGGNIKHRTETNKFELVETNPFNLDYENGLLKNKTGTLWDGYGIWYKETYNFNKFCQEKFNINGSVVDLFYDEIDFTDENYILCEDIIYKSESYKNNATNDIIFKDEKTLGLNYPLNERYDVIIDRGSSAAFERHLQLSEIKTWEDMENYRNGMYLNK